MSDDKVKSAYELGRTITQHQLAVAKWYKDYQAGVLDAVLGVAPEPVVYNSPVGTVLKADNWVYVKTTEGWRCVKPDGGSFMCTVDVDTWMSRSKLRELK